MRSNRGLTPTYNRFHDLNDSGDDIVKLRQLHHDMDCAVLRAYGWDDLAVRARPQHLTEQDEDEPKYQGRLFWPADFRNEVLARLLDLNAKRAAAEAAAGTVAAKAAPKAKKARKNKGFAEKQQSFL